MGRHDEVSESKLSSETDDRQLDQVRDYVDALFPVWPRTDNEYRAATVMLLKVYHPGAAVLDELDAKYSSAPGSKFRVLFLMFSFECDRALKRKKNGAPHVN